MAFYTGTANSWSDLVTVLQTQCVANGWSIDGNVIYKSGTTANFLVTPEANYLLIYGGTGKSGGALTGQSPRGSRTGGSYVTFPVNYDLHIFTSPDEVYLVINYNVDKYIQLSFGRCNLPWMNNAPWFTGSFSTLTGTMTDDFTINANSYICQVGRVNLSSFNNLGLFAHPWHDSQAAYSYCASNIYSDVGVTAEWKTQWYNKADFIAVGSTQAVASLLNCSPSSFNSGTILLPIKAYQNMGSKGYGQIVELENSRLCRIDNQAPGEVVTYGSEDWKVYPWYRKNSSVRSPVNSITDHSGTFGWAVRYTGP